MDARVAVCACAYSFGSVCRSGLTTLGRGADIVVRIEFFDWTHLNSSLLQSMRESKLFIHTASVLAFGRLIRPNMCVCVSFYAQIHAMTSSVSSVAPCDDMRGGRWLLSFVGYFFTLSFNSRRRVKKKTTEYVIEEMCIHIYRWKDEKNKSAPLTVAANVWHTQKADAHCVCCL